MATDGRSTLTKQEFFLGFLAAIRIVHGQTLRFAARDLHQAFHQAFSASRTPIFRDLAAKTDYDYDSLFGMSAWLVTGIFQAGRDLLVDIPTGVGQQNDIVIRFDGEEARRRLDALGVRKEFIALANNFIAAAQLLECKDFFELFMAGIRINGGQYWAAPAHAIDEAFRHALSVTKFPVPGGRPVEDIPDAALRHWLKNGLTYLRADEFVESNSNVLLHDYRVRMTVKVAKMRSTQAACARPSLRLPGPSSSAWPPCLPGERRGAFGLAGAQIPTLDKRGPVFLLGRSGFWVLRRAHHVS